MGTSSTLGVALRARRVELGRSLRSVAASSEVSPSFLSQVENDKARPRIETLHRIAAALDTTAQAVLAAASSESSRVDGVRTGHSAVGPARVVASTARVMRRADAATISQSDDPADGVVRSLVSGASGLHALEITGAPATFGAPYEHPGDELLYVISGRVEVQYGDDLHELGPGDSLSYSGDVPHRTRRLDGDVRLLIVTDGDD